jgi:hypothetical protein
MDEVRFMNGVPLEVRLHEIRREVSQAQLPMARPQDPLRGRRVAPERSRVGTNLSATLAAGLPGLRSLSREIIAARSRQRPRAREIGLNRDPRPYSGGGVGADAVMPSNSCPGNREGYNDT